MFPLFSNVCSMYVISLPPLYGEQKLSDRVGAGCQPTEVQIHPADLSPFVQIIIKA